MKEHVFENIQVETLPHEIRSAFNDSKLVKLHVVAQPNKRSASSSKNSCPNKGRTFEEIQKILSELPKITQLSEFSEKDLYDEFGLPK